MNQKHRASCTGGGRRARSLAALALVSLIAGCSAVVEGAARPTADLIARSLTGSTIRQVLLADDALSRILNRSFRIDPRFPPRFGGPETLQDDGWDAPGDCLGVAAMLQRVVYQSGQVRHVAVETWRHAPNSVEVTSVREGVVSLTSAAEARALFAKFAQQWQQCDGTTMPLSGTVFRLQAMANNVEVADSLVAATVSMGFASRTLDSAAIPSGRALGVRGNCLVEVEVAFFGNPQHHPQPTEPVAADPRSSAVDIARAILENVGAQS
ncbi:sensor domain-containing protein [Mycobacterium sp.]|uniref:sensor domain-containing protein n=1 Tax=Mycobacterium sp. TaxID=1785 RepID=UPI0025DD1FF7|nr:sensor domain-containing protein [Mycobacterium sp.]MBW0011662.1 sensor domain-containing protein [Mycobacterium sp.]